MRHTVVVSEDFAPGPLPGRLYVVDAAPDALWIRDGDARAVARLSVAPGGEVSSAAGNWRVEAERQGRGWVVVARELVLGEPVGCAYPRRWLNAFDLWVAPEQEYRLRENPFSGTWIVRGDLGEIARFTPGSARTIALAESVVPDPRLALVILLAYQAIRYSEIIPDAGSIADGGG